MCLEWNDENLIDRDAQETRDDTVMNESIGAYKKKKYTYIQGVP